MKQSPAPPVPQQKAERSARVFRLLLPLLALTVLSLCSRATQKHPHDNLPEKYGIGAAIFETDTGVVVRSCLPYGPASRAGLLPGDRVLAVDGHEVAGLSFTQILDLILTHQPQPATLEIIRRGERLSVLVQRERYSDIIAGAGFRFESDSLRIGLAPLDELPPLQVGQSRRGFWVTDSACTEAYLSLEGHGPTILYFWATWCDPCKWLMREIKKLGPSDIPRPTRIVGINVDRSCDIFRAAMDSLTPPGDQYWGYGMHSEVSQRLRAYKGIPCGALIDKTGKIQSLERGANRLLELLKAKPLPTGETEGD